MQSSQCWQLSVCVFRYETLTALLESNELGTVSEFNVFLAAMRWVEADESREHFLDEILGLIRFPTMDYEELGLVGKHPTAAGTAILKVSYRVASSVLASIGFKCVGFNWLSVYWLQLASSVFN